MYSRDTGRGNSREGGEAFGDTRLLHRLLKLEPRVLGRQPQPAARTVRILSLESPRPRQRKGNAFPCVKMPGRRRSLRSHHSPPGRSLT